MKTLILLLLTFSINLFACGCTDASMADSLGEPASQASEAGDSAAAAAMEAFNILASFGTEASKIEMKTYDGIDNRSRENNVKLRLILNQVHKQKDINKY